MIETRDYEVYTIEEKYATTKVIIDFLKTFPQAYMVVIENNTGGGVFKGLLNLSIIKNKVKEGKLWAEEKVTVRGDMFIKAREFFEDKRNRNTPLPVVSKQGELLTFFIWNQNLERNEEYLRDRIEKILELLEGNNTLEFKDWDEYTDYYYRAAILAGKRNQIICSGRNWEVCFEDDLLKKAGVGEYPILVNSKGVHYPLEEHEVIPLYDLQKNYNANRIYIWLDAIWALPEGEKLIFKAGRMVEGFCELKQQREIARVFGKKVEDLEEIAKWDDVKIIVCNDREKKYLENYISEEKIILFADLYGWNTEVIMENEFQAYGKAGDLNRLKCEVFWTNMKASCVSAADRADIPALLLWEYNKENKTYQEYMEQVDKKLLWYSKERVYETQGMTSGMIKIKNFDLALERNKQFIIYGIHSHYTNQWMHILESFGIAYILMEDEEIENWYGYTVESIFELPYYDLDKVFVIINKPYHMLEEAVAMLRDYGISLEDNNCISIYEQIANQDRGTTLIDICAGPIPQMLGGENYPGYYVFGQNRKTDYKIMIVGGSTTDSTFYNYASWPEILYHKFQEAGKSVTIFNGAVGGYYSMQELSKLIRDIVILKPDIVISYSGVNDNGTAIRSVGYINGMVKENDDVENVFARWLRHEKMMQKVAEENGADFCCFAQPYLSLEHSSDKYEIMFQKADRGGAYHYYDEWKKSVKEVQGCPWFIDCTDLFEKNKNVYIDPCHVTIEGNQIIANFIYEHMQKNLGKSK